MKVKANPAYERFRRTLNVHRALFLPWSGASYRATTLDYPKAEQILSGEGSFLNGGRWNAIRSFRAVYGSTSDVVAVAESRATASYAGIPYLFRTPRLLVTIEFELARVLDLTNPEIAGVFDATSEEFRLEDWRKVQSAGDESATQALGRACFDAGANALLVSSARVPDGINVVYFPENHSGVAEAFVCEPGKLDRIRGRDE
ncbi:MAG: RES family NAD+ phosphorylase [Verrucomicrobiota bacterium]|nr:RES family NAD+ phosphorylase [Verrucomicrobiota bacterium]